MAFKMDNDYEEGFYRIHDFFLRLNLAKRSSTSKAPISPGEAKAEYVISDQG